MEKSYYSTDDEIAWGPLTLDEIKMELQKPPRDIKGRETDFGHSTFFTPSTTFSEEKATEDRINNSSGTSAYFTPNESIAQTTGQKNPFLEKLAQVIESENFDTYLPSPQKTVLECNVKKDSLLKILDEEEDEENKNLEKIHHTLVDNTIQFSPEKFRQSIFENISIDNSSNESYLNSEIIVISDASSDNLEHSLHEESPIHVKIKEETSTVSQENSNILNETDGLLTESLSQDEDDLIMDKMYHVVLSDISEKNYTTEEQNSEDEDSVNNVRKLVISSPTNCDLSDASAALVFNDTMEEIEMALKQGLDYEMPNDSKSSPRNFSYEAVSVQNQMRTQVNKKLRTPNKYDYIQSPVADYIKKKSPVRDNFKLPTRPPKSKVITPNPKSPLMPAKQFQNIMSPVGVYIKNSTLANLKQNVAVKTVPFVKSSAESDLIKSKKENIVFPEVVYKPRRKIVTSAKKDIVLPSSIQKMVPDNQIAKHETGISRPVNSISRKLLDGDLTSVDASVLNQSGEDVSFIQVKQALIK